MQPGNKATALSTQTWNNTLSRDMVDLGTFEVISSARRFFLLDPQVSALWCVGSEFFMHENSRGEEANTFGAEYGLQIAGAVFNSLNFAGVEEALK
jgi:hypothetical protein